MVAEPQVGHAPRSTTASDRRAISAVGCLIGCVMCARRRACGVAAQFRRNFDVVPGVLKRGNQQPRHQPVTRRHRVVRRFERRVEGDPHRRSLSSRARGKSTAARVCFDRPASMRYDNQRSWTPHQTKHFSTRCRFSSSSRASPTATTTGRCPTAGRWQRPTSSARPRRSQAGATRPSTWRAPASSRRS